MQTQDGFFNRAREWMNGPKGRWATAGICLLAIAGAVAWFVRDNPTSDEKRIRELPKKVVYYCRACKASGVTYVPPETPLPIDCPACGKREAVAGFKCFRCKRIIEAKREAYFVCPYCGYVYDARIQPGEAPPDIRR
jgi:hypothetical protein